MTTTTEAGADPRRGLRWWREVLYVIAFYAVYSVVRNNFGSAAVSAQDAFANAEIVIDIERALGLFVEEAVQQAFLPWEGFIRFWNIFYGTFHFVVTAVALIALYRRAPERYRLWRTTLAAMTGLAIIGFALFPLMPPRLVPGIDPSYEFVDTLVTVGGLWSFDSGTMKSISNQYAAMPSLHIGWALWSTLVLVPLLRHPWSKALAIAYPVATLFAIVVTANHFWLDAVGGAIVLGAGFAVARAVTPRFERDTAAAVEPALEVDAA